MKKLDAATSSTARRFSVALLLSFLGGLAALGCASAPPGPRGPLLGPGVEVATDWSYAEGQAEATLPDGSSAKGSADYYWSSLAIVPRRVEARVSPLPWMDVGGQVGWLDGGVDVRVGLPAAEGRFLAFNLAAGFETGAVGFFDDTKKGLGSKWLRLEGYPLLPFAKQFFRLVIAGGVDFGTFYHELPNPHPPTTFEDGPGTNDISIIRRETRLETSLGVFFYPRRVGSVLLTVNPYFVLDAGSPSADCSGCEQLAAYRENWGIVFVSRFAFRHGF